MHYRPHVSIVVPTYCEGKNLAELARRTAAALTKAGHSYELVVVDDESPDETPRICHALARKMPLRLIVRQQQRGLASAVVAGMQAAAGTLLVVMDADLSHPPEVIPDLVALLQRPEVDFAIGSRYIAGGATDGDWGMIRRWNSRVATWLARGLTQVRDPLSGFFALRRTRFLEAQHRLDPLGFKIGLELIVKTHSVQVVETPIRFANRRYGESKLSWRQQLEYLQHLARLYRYRRNLPGPSTAAAEQAEPESAVRRAA